MIWRLLLELELLAREILHAFLLLRHLLGGLLRRHSGASFARNQLRAPAASPCMTSLMLRSQSAAAQRSRDVGDRVTLSTTRLPRPCLRAPPMDSQPSAQSD